MSKDDWLLIDFKSISGLTYAINIEGRVINNIYGNELKRHVDRHGYLRVTIGGSVRFVHRLVIETFKGKAARDDLEVDHVDGDKLNNHPNNLEWVTHKENITRYWKGRVK